ATTSTLFLWNFAPVFDITILDHVKNQCAHRDRQGRIAFVTDSRDPTEKRSDDALPRRAVARTARLAGLPLGMAGRTVSGWGRRLTGQSSDEVNAAVSAKTAEQLFEVLGSLKGGAMKFGQALSVFEAAVP